MYSTPASLLSVFRRLSGPDVMDSRCVDISTDAWPVVVSKLTRNTCHHRPSRGTAQIAVKIQHKNRLLTDPGATEDGLAVEDDVVPFDRADVLGAGLRQGLP